MSPPVAIDLCCGLGGWTDGLLAVGYEVTGYDIEAHEYGGEKYPAALILKSILDLHGSEIAHADLIVASPPCQAYSWMAMPWSRAKAAAMAIRADETAAALAQLNALFDSCFRLQREACEAAGRHIPMVVENVRGAQPWVGRAAWNYGSYYLWGDVPALMPRVSPGAVKVPAFRFDGSGKSFQTESVRRTDVGKGARFTFNAASGGISRTTGSKSHARKAASARIAKIPFALSSWVAKVFLPDRIREAA